MLPMTGNEAWEIVEKARAAGMTMRSICERLGCCRRTLYNWRDKGGARVRGAVTRNLEAFHGELLVKEQAA